VNRNSAGSSYLTILVVLLLISVLFIGVSTVAHMVARTSVIISEKQELREQFVREAERVMSLLTREASKTSESPEADSVHDIIWREIQFCQVPEASISLEDISSRLNPNWMMRTLFSKTKFSQLLNSDKTPDDLQAYREKQGLSVNIKEHYLDFFSEENLEKYFTGYSYFNINITDEFVLKTIYAQRTGKTESEAENFRLRVQNKRLAQNPLERLILNKDLQHFLSDDYDALFPVINSEPLFNVNFVDKEILEEIIKYPYPDQGENRKIDTHVLAWILSERENRELTEKDLKTKITPKYEKRRIEQFLGAKTWFWKISISKGETVLVWIVARLPQSITGTGESENTDNSVIYYSLIEEDFKE
jgi:hypothetical protein